MFIKEAHMNSITDGSVIIQMASESIPSAPGWFGEVTLIAEHLRQQGVLTKIREQVRFAPRGKMAGATRSGLGRMSSRIAQRVC
ncbi:MAG TPA: hypothetical protein VGT99_12685 [Gammaproteobacteria bacterium]|nr:hypothetical protein [Gammaproteobacteria bacterium]